MDIPTRAGTEVPPTDIINAYGPLFLGSRLKRLAERMQADAARAIRAEGFPIQPAHFPLLAAIDSRGPLSVGEAARLTGVSQPGVTRGVASLVKLGLLETLRDDEDQRLRTLALSAAGRALMERAKSAFWPRVAGAAESLCDGLSGPLLDQIAGLEARLDARSLEQRIAALPAPPAGSGLVIRGYDDSLAEDFYRINAEWIGSMFTLEDKDREILRHPRETIIDQGGLILFVETPDAGIVGTCALIRIDEGCYELTKMGVSEAARGRKAGEYLLRHMLQRAADRGIETLYLLTSHRCAAAIHLYEKLGFAHDAEIMARYGSRYQRCDVAMRYRG